MTGQYRRTIVLGLDHSEFIGGVAETNRAMGLLEAKFKLASEQAKGFGTESDQLRIKQEALTQKMEIQKKLVGEASKAYDEATTSGTATAKQTDNLKKRLLEQMTALERMNNELRETDEALENAEGSQRSFGDTIKDAAGFLGMEANPMIAQFAEGFDGVDESVGKAAITTGIFVSAAGMILKAMYDASVGVAQYADDVLTLSTVTGISTDTLQEMQYASEFVDVSVELMNGSMTKLTANMGKAREGNAELHKAFVRMGVQYKDSDGNLRKVEDTFYDIIDALGKVKNETDRDVMAMQIFGKTAKELNPLIDSGSESLKELGEEAKEMGYVLSGEALESAGSFEDAMQKLSRAGEALQNNLGLVLLPVLTALFDTLSRVPIPVLVTLISLMGAIATVVSIASAINTVTKAVTSVTGAGEGLNKMFEGFNASTIKTIAIVLGIVAALIALGVIIATIMGKSNDLSQSMSSIGDGVSQVTSTVSTAQKPKYNAKGTEFFEGGETWVGEHGTELVTLPRGSKISPSDNGGINNYYNVTIPANDIQELADIAKIIQGKQVAIRRGVVGT